ncbi:TPA: phosphate butyryltransferase [Candidatus Marinimicrobia bacterium]|nr:phosphate butyryltransferase [Candidatus Neomarinimicrobiota bacterium]HBY17713.1 phosphate butyryltransferase [Candidatus Neomarinimicrobiota bacterium]
MCEDTMRFIDLYERVSACEPKNCNVVNPEADSVFEGLRQAADQGLIRLRLFGNRALIEEKAEQHQLKISAVYHAPSPVEAAVAAIADIREGGGDLIMKGDIPTADFMKPLLDKEKGLRTGKVLSHVAVCDTPAYPQLLFAADGGINIAPDLDTKREITEGTVAFAEKILGRKPRIAFAAVIEKVNPKIPATGDAFELAREYTERGYPAEGPMALDVILSEDAARKKGIQSQISGKVDVIIFPEITPANFMIKQMIFLEQAKAGGLILNASVPVIVLSRSDTAETKLNSIVLSLL